MKTIIKSIISVIVSVLLFLSSFVTIATAIVKYKLTNIDYYIEKVVTDEYVDALYDDIYKNVTIACENLEVHRDTVMSFVNKDELKRISKANFQYTFSSLISGAPLQFEPFGNEELKTDIYKELETFANEMGITEDISHATEVTYDFIIEDINATLTYFTQDNMNMVGFVSRIPGLNFVMDKAFYIALAATVLLCVLKILIMGKRRILSAAYNISFMLWLGSACWFVPITVIKLHDVASKIAIAYSGFRLYVQNLINAVIDGFFNISLFAFVITLVLLIASIVTIIICASKAGKKRNQTEEISAEEESLKENN